MESIALTSASLDILLTLLSTTLAGILSQDQYPEWVNDLIVLIFALLAALLSVYVNGGLTGNIVVAVLSALPPLLGTSLKPLQRWIQYLQSTVIVKQNGKLYLIARSKIVESNNPRPLPATTAQQTPQPIVLPNAPKTMRQFQQIPPTIRDLSAGEQGESSTTKKDDGAQ